MNLHHKIQSQLHNKYKELEQQQAILQYLFLEISQRCNLNCLHCGSDCKSNTNQAELTTPSWKKIITSVKQQFSDKVAFIITGGEPLMHPDLDEITQHIARQNMRWAMVTNGMLLNQKRMQMLLKNNIYSLTISLDGTKNAHNLLRNHPKAFEKVEHALKLIAQSDIPQKDVVTCVFPANLNQLDEMAAYLINKGIAEWRLFRIFPSGRAKNNRILQLSFDQTQQMVQWIAQNKKKYNAQGLNINLSCEGWLPWSTDKQVRDNPFFCRAGVNIASILANGNITGCTNNQEPFHVGNILKDNLAYVWKNNFDDFRNRTWVSQTQCSACNDLKYCQGGSIHLWEQTTGKPNFCYAHNICET